MLEIAGAPEAATLAEWTRATLRRSGLDEAHCRITVTRGVGRRGLDPRGCDAPTVLVAALPLRPYPAEAYERGIAATLLWPRATADRPPPSVKSTSYQRSVLGRLEVARRDADEGLFLDDSGNVTEGTTSNVFAVLDGQLVTPTTDGCLAGITRSEVLAIAGRAGQAASETAISPSRSRPRERDLRHEHARRDPRRDAARRKSRGLGRGRPDHATPRGALPRRDPSPEPRMSTLHRACRIEKLPDAVSAFDALRHFGPTSFAALLESRGAPSKIGRYDFLCLDPFLVFRSKRRECFVGPPGRLERPPGIRSPSSRR